MRLGSCVQFLADPGLIDHLSIAISDLARATPFWDAMMAADDDATLS